MENIFFVKYPRMYLVEDTFIGYVYKVRDKMDLFLNLSKALVFLIILEKIGMLFVKFIGF